MFQINSEQIIVQLFGGSHSTLNLKEAVYNMDSRLSFEEIVPILFFCFFMFFMFFMFFL